jgi:diamine N-acetyltransferase
VNYDIYIRPLREEDAAISYNWRNDSEVWKYTGKRPDRLITLEIEEEWIKEKIRNKNEKRYAICLTLNDKYIGNVQLTNISKDTAEFHIFIGDKDYWNKGIGQKATKRMIELGFKELSLKEIFLEVDVNNIPAIKAYERAGFDLAKQVGQKVIMKIENNE